VSAKLEVTGIDEHELVADKGKQVSIMKGFSDATGINVSDVTITQIGDTKIRRRQLAGKVSIIFQIKAATAAAAQAVKDKVVATSADKITQGIAATGIADIVAISAPSAMIKMQVPLPTPTHENKELDNKTHSSGANIGAIAIGGILFIVLLGFLAWKCHSKCRRDKTSTLRSNSVAPKANTKPDEGGGTKVASESPPALLQELQKAQKWRL
jgi:hypothetical protein